MTGREERVAALERWADTVETDDLREVDMSSLRTIAELADQRQAVEVALAEAVHQARLARRSWSEIGAMLGVSKQAAQRKYGSGPAAA